jgi:hypothetical protein
LAFFQGNAAEIATRLTAFTDSRANLRKWPLPSYARYLEFPAYETQMKAIFHDAFIFDVVVGRALRTAPVAGEAQIITDKRAIYDECSLQAYSVIIRTYTTENSGAVENDGRALWQLLVEFNYGITADNIPHLKVAFYDGAQFRQKKGRSIDECEMPVPLSLPMGMPSQNPKRLSYFEKVSFVKICNRASFFPPEPRLLSNWL